MTDDSAGRIWLTLPGAREKYQKKRVAVTYKLPAGKPIAAIGELWVYKKSKEELFAIDLVFDFSVNLKLIRHQVHLTKKQIDGLTPQQMETHDFKFDGVLTAAP